MTKFPRILLSGCAAIAFASSGTTAAIARPAPSSFDVAQFGGTCRQVSDPNGAIVYAAPDDESEILRRLEPGEVVTLPSGFRQAIEDSRGRLWIPIAAPAEGYIFNGYAEGNPNLSRCEDANRESPAQQNICGRVLVEQGLNIREYPNRRSAREGLVAYNEYVTLVDGEGIIGPEGRTWFEISFPTAGFVSNGRYDESNLGFCSLEYEG